MIFSEGFLKVPATISFSFFVDFIKAFNQKPFWNRISLEFYQKCEFFFIHTVKADFKFIFR